jgi:hypothetical protein
MKFVNLTKLIAVPHQIHTYTELLQQIHGDLRIQHPEWVRPNGESPMCDSYEARLTELLDTLTRRGDPTSLSLLLSVPSNRELEGKDLWNTTT